MRINPVSVVKFAVTAVVSLGTKKIVANVIKNNVKPETVVDKVTVLAAAWVISGIASEVTKKFTDEMIDSVVESGTEIVEKFKLSSKLGRINREESTFEKEGLDQSKFRKDVDSGKWISIVEHDDIDIPVSDDKVNN